MGENVKTEKKGLKSWFKGLKQEFNKIFWPSKETLGKETGVVIIVMVLLGIIISAIDFVLQYGMQFAMEFFK